MQDKNETRTTVAIIGAGIAGLTCARALQAQNTAVQVFEKSRGVGGRMSTRSGPTWQCDHGAQYFTATSKEFRDELARWEVAGVASQWAMKMRVIDGTESPWRATAASTTRYVGVPTMTAPAKFLAESLAVHLSEHVDGLAREPSGWRIHIHGKGWHECLFDAVVLALPAPQAQALLKQAGSSLQNIVASVRMRPAWALMMTCDATFDPGFDAAFVNSGPLRWVARNRSKPQRHGDNMWLLHATAEWSEAHLEVPTQDVARSLLAEFQKICPLIPQEYWVHRWRYADTESSVGQDFLWDPEQGIGLCGDWLQEAKVEGAWCSAIALAKAITDESKVNLLDIKLNRIEFASSLYESALELRDVVLRKPLGRSLDFKDLDDENNQLHFGITNLEDKLIACLCVKIIEEKHYKIRQMAVSDRYQRQGLGKKLIDYVERSLVACGVTMISLHARESAIEFYEKLGFRCTGKLFDEVGVPHIKMHKKC